MDPLRHDNNSFQMPNMSAPPLMNPPPRIFGAYSADGLPDMSEPIFGDDTPLDDSNEAKRRRIARVEYTSVRDIGWAMADDLAGLRYVQEEED
jgi:hypothetical protein